MFWLGTHLPAWLSRTEVPLFVSRRRLSNQRTWRRALGPWALDSGGYTELSMHGRWSVAPAAYAREVRGWRDEIGGLEWCAPQDWMCEPNVRLKTGLSVAEHQRRTIENFGLLRAELGGLVVPVLQGWEFGDFLEHVEAYDAAGFDLRAEPLVGVGSVCRRHADAEVAAILDELSSLGLSLHAFGVRGRALQSISRVAASADSMAWSYRARKAARAGEPRPTPCTHRGSCSNCMPFALWWRGEQLGREAVPVPDYQLPIGGVA